MQSVARADHGPSFRTRCPAKGSAHVDLKRHWGLSADPVEERFLAENACLSAK